MVSGAILRFGRSVHEYMRWSIALFGLANETVVLVMSVLDRDFCVRVKIVLMV